MQWPGRRRPASPYLIHIFRLADKQIPEMHNSTQDTLEQSPGDTPAHPLRANASRDASAVGRYGTRNLSEFQE